MKKICLVFMLLLMTGYVNAQGFSKAEYFFDIDPGPGNGIAITANNTSDTLNFTTSISTSSLAQGFHLVGARIKHKEGTWGLFEWRSFYITPAPSVITDITAAEYFFDTDPGIGNGTGIPVNSPGTTYKDSIVLAVGSLPLGDHRIVMRVKNADGKWSLMENQPFKVCTQDGPQSMMQYHIEYNKVFFTNQSTGADSTKWLFGDNTSDTVIQPVKTYANAGNYTVKLISKNVCAVDTLTRIVPVNGLQRISGNSGGDTGIVSVSADGVGFTNTTPFKLIRGNTILLPVSKQFISSERINTYFNFTGADTGVYHAVADISGGAFDTLENAFTITVYKKANISIAGSLGPLFSRPGLQFRTFVLQNQGNEDGIMVPFIARMGYVTGPLSPQMYLQDSVLDVTNKGVFQNTYQYLSSKGISTDVMNAFSIDTANHRQLLAMYKIRIPASSNVQSNIKIIGNQGQLSYQMGGMVQPPMYRSGIVLDDTLSNVTDCMNSFLKKAVRNNLAVSIDANAWNNCFKKAFDTLTRTIRTVAKDINASNKAIPIKAVFSTLLAQMSQCSDSGVPSTITSAVFRKIINDVTYNWLFWENLDSIGRPCIDTTETVVLGRSVAMQETVTTVQQSRETDDEGPCPGLENSPELLEQCIPFLKICGLQIYFEKADALSQVYAGTAPFAKITGGIDYICKLNSGSVSCLKLCEGNSADPNVKYGPGDNAGRKHINHVLNSTYSVFFENMASATAAAAYVEITDTLDMSSFDMRSFQLGSYGWGDSLVILDANRTDYSLLKDLRPLRPNKLRIDFRLDTLTGIAKWKFYTVDTVTLQLTIDPAQGFLPPNVDGKEGIGFVSFNIRPKNGVTSGTVIHNKATIVFDENQPIITPIWEHIIDTTRPQSQVSTLPSVTGSRNFVVNWSGTDEHAGIASYSVYVSINDSVFKKWKFFTTAVSDTFHGEFNKTYKFYSVALDKANNFEDEPGNPLLTPDAVTMTQIPLPLKWLSFSVTKLQNPDRSRLDWKTENEINTSHFEVERSIDGMNFIKLANVTAVNSIGINDYSYTDNLPVNGINYYRLKQADKDGHFSYSKVLMVNFGKEERLVIYPTLVTTEFTIYGAKTGNTLQLIDASGRLIKQIRLLQDNQTINIAGLQAGIYMVKIINESGAGQATKLIKQ